MEIPHLKTERLNLRPFLDNDSLRVKELAGDIRVAETTANIPQPYYEKHASEWIANHSKNWIDKKTLTLAVVDKSTNDLMGCISLNLNDSQKKAELMYWVGVPFWNNGYCTEAATTMIDFAFSQLEYHKISARHMSINSSSGRVLKKLGMKKEGCLRQDYMRSGERHDIVVYGLLKDEFYI